MKIGLVYVEGAVPAFEDFGFLPTHLVKNNGMVEGFKAHKILDGLIIPGGTIVESASISQDLQEEIHLMNREGKFILGICSGFQVLANETDVGRRSPRPIIKKGLGILDVNFYPMISNDRVKAQVVGESFLTEGLLGDFITGFHCHTYGHIEGEAKPVLKSQIKRTDYSKNPREILAGVKNQEGNVVGTMLHGSLDENPELIDNILNFLGADEKQKSRINEFNSILLKKIKKEVGINTGIKVKESSGKFNNWKSNQAKLQKNDPNLIPPTIIIGSTGSDSGKTFISTGLAGNFHENGLKVAILKIGPDVRDIVPALYLTKGKMEQYSSIKIANLGWMDLEIVLKHLKRNKYDLVIIEGVMGILTGILNEKIPYSGAEIAAAANIPIILVSGCNKGGIETAAVDLVAHINILRKMQLNIPGVILNRVYDQEIFQKASQYIKKETNIARVMGIPKINLKARGSTPEVQIKLEDFCISAQETIKEHLNLSQILRMAKNPIFSHYKTRQDLEELFQLK